MARAGAYLDRCGTLDPRMSNDTPDTKRTPVLDFQSLPRDTVIYISGPMTGRPNFNYEAFEKAEEWLRAQGFFHIKNPIHCDPEKKPAGERTWQWYMRKCIIMLMESDVMFMLEGWPDSRGAMCEYKLGHDDLDMDVYYEKEEVK